MRILAFDTATAATTVALTDPDVALEIEERDDPAPHQSPRHTTRLMAMIVEVVAVGGGWESIDRIAVGVGPGTFTGLRIGISTARALSWSRGIGLTGISTLEALAMNAGIRHSVTVPDPFSTVLAVLDARRGEAFAAAWRLAAADGAVHTPTEQLLAPSALDPAELANFTSGLAPGALAIGPGAVEFRSALERSGAQVPADGSTLHRVSALHHCRLAATRPADEEITPQYLRLPDAELARRRK